MDSGVHKGFLLPPIDFMQQAACWGLRAVHLDGECRIALLISWGISEASVIEATPMWGRSPIPGELEQRLRKLSRLMCGIAGLANQWSRGSSCRDPCSNGNGSQTPRPGRFWSVVLTQPPGSGSLPPVRLSILDLSPAGHQPMTSSSGRYTITFNGEIYNFEEIRSEFGRAHLKRRI